MFPQTVATLFDSASANIPYKGTHVSDTQECKAWLNGPVRKRAYDYEEVTALQDFIVVEGFDNSAISAIIGTPDEPLAQQDIGETIAELALQAEMQAIWPTNRRRDMRSVRASLPGADIVGFVPCEGGYRFLFGEVKTSSDKKSPPAVMYGDTGLEFQLHTLATNAMLIRRLLSYVYCRVRDTELMEIWRQAFARLSEKVLTEARLVGVLVRDTLPQEKDVSHHANLLSKKLPEASNISLLAVYICIPAKDWAQHCPPI